MTTGGPIPEHDLLDLVEGTLAPEREAVVRAAVARDPRLSQLVARLRADRRALMGLGVAGGVRAPAGLAERVEAALEREALLGLGTGEASSPIDTIPISQLRPARASLVVRAWRSPVGRGVAMAAGLALLVGGGYLAVSALSPGIPVVAPEHTTIASNDRPAVGGEPAGEPVEVAGIEPEPGASDANAAPGPDGGGTAVAMEIFGPPLPDAAAMTAVASTEPVREPMPAARALELARQGRLAIVVRAKDPLAAAAGVETLAKASGRPGGAGVWQRLDGAAAGGALARGYETVAALWTPNFAPGTELVPLLPGRPQGPALAAGGDDAPVRVPFGTGLEPPLGPWRPMMAAPPEAVWTVSVDDRESTLASLLSAVARDGRGERAEFVELPVAIDAPPPADPDAVLWWTQPASAWGWRLSVPVVVEGAR